MDAQPGESMKLKELAENLEMEVDEFLEIMELFLETSAFDLNQLEAGIEEGDGQRVIIAAHSIKGAAVNLGLLEIYEAARKTEMEARENNLNGATVAARAIKEKIDQITEDLLKAESSKLFRRKQKSVSRR
jgi:HPt (histidine-containing phosphotransfer) domain-containing protein